ncbi:MAG TPA: sensor histidine kinase [Clostridiales bacterium]|nr:sensor histidine kinase [Clostridiales bacterium]
MRNGKRPRKHPTVRLRTITILSVTLALLVSVSVCIAVFASVYSKTVLRDAQVNAEQAVEQTATAVGNSLDGMKAKLTAISGVVRECATAEEFSARIAALTAVEREIFAVTVYNRDGGIAVTVGSGDPRKEAPLRDLSFDRALFEAASDFALSAPHVQTLFEGVYPWVVTLAVRTEEPVFSTGAYIAIDFGFSELAEYIDKVGVGRHGYCYLIDSAGISVYHPQQQLIFSGLRDENTEYIATLSDGTHTERNRIYTVRTVADSDWRVVGVSFTDEVAVERRTQILGSVSVSLGCTAVILCAVLLVYSRFVNRPVRELAGAMERFEAAADSFRYTAPPTAVTELQTLSDSFGHLTARVRDLMEEIRREETELRKTELKALQAQINPHFLYNTLDSVQWMCERGKTEDAARMVRALAKLFRISISRGHELIPLSDELEHARSYLVIQSFRYRDQFSYRFDVDEGLGHYLCNKITIQPLIENAIYHGIDRMVDEGEIIISVHEAADNPNDILITVSDNGVGMTPEQCRKILQKARSDSGGIGVKNVNDRLKIRFGERFGITLKSEQDVGTVVTVRIPKITDEEEQP